MADQPVPVVPLGTRVVHEAEYRRLVDLLEEAARTSGLPEEPSARSALHDLLIRLRLHGSRGGA